MSTQKRKQIVPMLKQTFADWSEDNAMRLAAALACYTILSLAPLVVITMKVATWVLHDQARTGQVKAQLTQLIGPSGAQAINDMVASDQSQNSGLLATAFSLIILLFSASGVFAALQDALNTIWEVRPKPDLGWGEMIKKRFLSMGMVFSIIFLLLVSMFVTSLLSVFVNQLFGSGGENASFLAKAAAFVVDFVVTVAVVGALFTLMFKYLPDVKVRFADVWVGGLVTAVLFKLGQYALTAYFHYGSTTSAYGAAGSLVAVLLWAYYSACILFFGAEFTQVYAKQYGSGIRPDDHAEPMTAEARAQQGMASSSKSPPTGGRGQKRGGAIPPYRQPAPSRRVVTVEQPAQMNRQGYLIAAGGLAAGLIVGAAGVFTGRKWGEPKLTALQINERLDAIEKRVAQEKSLNRYGKELALTERVAQIEQRVTDAATSLKRNANPPWYVKLAQPREKKTPPWYARIKEYVG